MSHVSALILAGGRSQRFGFDKTAIPWGGETLLGTVISVARGVSDDVIVLGSWSRHETDEPSNLATRVLHDPEPFPGPLVALTTGLVHVRHDICLVLAADMPKINRHVLELMAATALQNAATNAVALEHDGRLQPLPLVIRARRAYPYLVRIVSTGERKLRAVLDMPETHAVAEDVWQAADKRHDSLRDIDTPADYAELLARATGSAAATSL